MRRVRKQPDGCWIYQTESPNRNGYAYVRVGSRAGGAKRRSRGVHVVALEAAINRTLEPRERALHHCDVKLCVNPEHLYAGTHGDNMRDRDERGRTIRGADHVSAKLTPETVQAAKRDRESGLTYAELGAKYGVSTPTIWKAVNDKTWRSGDYEPVL